MPKRLAIARACHEGNSFNPVLTGLQAFERREWVAGEAARIFYAGTCSELAAAVDFFERHSDWDGTLLLCVKAKSHFRAAFAETFAAILDVDTPGPAAPDLARLPFRRVPPARLPPG